MNASNTPRGSLAYRKIEIGPVVLSPAQRGLCEFHGYAKDDLAMARLIAAEVCQTYGQDTPEELDRIRRGEIWNDHVAVQAALAAIRVTKGES